MGLLYAWALWARPEQLAPPGDWSVWLTCCGRGWGKTRTGAEWIQDRATSARRRIILAGATAGDVRDIMIEGDSGILAVAPPWARPKYQPSKRRLTWPNGSVANLLSGEEPRRFRGKQCDTFWCDELASWRYPESYDQLKLGFRLGTDPRGIVTTTPRPVPVVKDLIKDPDTHVTYGTTYDNFANLARSFRRTIAKYEGTRLGRQELLAHLLEDAPGALWKRAQIDKDRVRRQPSDLAQVVIAVDPAVSTNHGEGRSRSEEDEAAKEKRRSNKTAIVAVGLDSNGEGYLLEVAAGIWSPHEWGTKVLELYDGWDADHVTAEVNNGGDLVVSNMRTLRPELPVRTVHASRGKFTRAEPVSTIYEQHRIHHLGTFGELEDQLCQWEPALGLPSPDELDALVWGFTDLMVTSDPRPQRRRGGVVPARPLEDRAVGVG